MLISAVVIVLAAFYTGVLADGDPENEPGRIVGGNVTSIENRPYQVSLAISKPLGTALCGGSIIGSRTILTAAHCLLGAYRVQVRSGSNYFKKGGIVTTAQSYRIHYLYNMFKYDYDIGVVLLSDANSLDLRGKSMKAVPLAPRNAELKTDDPVIVSGWGTTKSGGKVSEVLMEVTVPIVNRTQCQEDYTSITISERMICAGQGGKDSCQGDSGGPLIDEKGYQYGIVSFGRGCADPRYPGVYSNVAKFRDWIYQNGGV